MNRFIIALLVVLTASYVRAADLGVGPGEQFTKIEDAYAAAAPGDTISVHPLANGAAYDKVVLQLTKPNITLRGAADKGGGRVKLSGTGFDYSGVGNIPRAIIQFEPEASGCTVEGFELSGAHNDSHNGAGFRINQANDVTIRGCDIHDNDMGIMSGGNEKLRAGANQFIENCIIHDNGDLTDPGYNHNLYLGGKSAIVRNCEIYGAKTGHNIKSRCHFTLIEWCYVHDAANRELDLVDSPDTDVANSDAVLLGNVIVKKQNTDGNKSVIHFGKDGKNDHNGMIYLINNTIVTPYISPVVDLTSITRAYLANNLICDGGVNQQGQKVLGGISFGPEVVTATHNHFTANFAGADGTVGFASADSAIARPGDEPKFADPTKGDYHLAEFDPAIVRAGVRWNDVQLSADAQVDKANGKGLILGQFVPPEWPAGDEPSARKDADEPTMGGYEFVPKK